MRRIILLDSDSDSEATNRQVEILSDDSSCSSPCLLVKRNKSLKTNKNRPFVLDDSESEEEEHEAEDDHNLNDALNNLNITESEIGSTKKKLGQSQLDLLHFSSSSDEDDENEHANDFDHQDTEGSGDSNFDDDSSVISLDREKYFRPNAPTMNVSTLSSPRISGLIQSKEELVQGNQRYIQLDDSSNESVVEDTAWYRNKSGEYKLCGTSSINEVITKEWPNFIIPKKLFDKLYYHQKVGVQWMASLYMKGIGGILGDDMGLGKTFQILTLIGGLMRARTIRNALIICPVAVLQSWEREAVGILRDCCSLNVMIRVMDSKMNQARRAMVLKEALRCTSSRPNLIITSYGLVKSNPLDFIAKDESLSRYWDYIICDEGHLLKNHTTEQHKACARICRDDRTHRLLLTGTPIQNNMKEFWALMDWATSGKLFGAQKTFMNTYAIPIEEGRNKAASEHTMRIAFKANKALQEKLKPHFLQRMKNQEFKSCLPDKTELVVWLRLSDLQRELYEKYVVDGGKVAAILSGEMKSPLEAITYLKKLCDHPALVHNHGEFEKDVDSLRRHSPKLDVLVYLVKKLVKSGHKCLIFSPSTKVLDIISQTLPIRLGRIDGSVDGKSRQNIADRFNKEDSCFDALLLSTKAAGVGLTLTGADRAIIYSPSWNPADDNQAVDRCFRIGQDKSVVVYRFVTGEGSVEERMYEKQVHKDGIRRTLMTSSGCATERHFSESELKRMFELKGPGECEMLQKVFTTSDENGPRSTLSKHQRVIGVASHDLVYMNSIVDLTNVNASPFCGTPVKWTATSVVDLDSKRLTFENLSAIHVTNKHDLEYYNASHLENQTNKNCLGISLEKNCAANQATLDDIYSSEVQVSFELADDLAKQGNVKKSLNFLFDVLENHHSLPKAQKMILHKKIAARIEYLKLH